MRDLRVRKMGKRGQFDLSALLLNPWVYIIFAVAMVSGMFSRTFKRFNITRNTMWVIVGVGLLFSYGVVSLAMFGVGATGGVLSNGITIDRIQTTTAFTMDNDSSGVDLADVGTDDTKMSVFYVNESFVSADPIIEAGIFAVTRKGPLDANSCEVRVFKPARCDIADTTYHFVNEDVDTGVMTAYVMAASSSSAADSNDPKESAQLPFAEGVATGYVSFLIELDETGIDPLSIYDTKDVRTSICGYPYVFRIVKADA